MRILIRTERLPDPSWYWDPKNPLTGTTKFYVRVAEELARKHQVVVESDGGNGFHIHNGVEYRNRGYMSPADYDLCLDCNYQRTPDEARSRDMFQWTSFYGRPDTCVGAGYDRLFLISDFIHSTLAPHVKCPVSVVELGCDLPTLVDVNLESRGKVCCYTSSPDRGGNFLDQIWPEVQAATGYGLEKSPYSGTMSVEALTQLYLRSRFWLYPALGLSSIVSALEAQACGCIPVYVPHMDLPETVRFGVAAANVFEFKDELIKTLKTADLDALACGRRTALEAKPIPQWKIVAEQILSLT